jgi:hypothetical protein
LRLPAALFGILTVAGIYLLGCELDSVNAGLWAALFLATSTWHLFFSRVAFRAIGGPLFLVWSMWLLLVALRRKSPALALAAGCIYGLGFHTYIAYRATPLLLAVVLWRKPARLAGAFTTAAAVVVAPLAVYFLNHPADFMEHSARLSAHSAAELALNTWRTTRMIFTRGDINWRHNIPWRAEVFWPIAILFAVGLLRELWGRLQRQPGRETPPPGSETHVRSCGAGFSLRGASAPLSQQSQPLPAWVSGEPARGYSPLASVSPAILPLWLLIAAIPAVLSNEGVPHALRSLLMLPAICLLAARAARSIRAPAPAIALAALILAYEPYHTYFDVWARDPHVAAAFDAPASQIAAQIRALPPDADKYVATGPPELLDAEPVMYLTRSCAPNPHIHYVAAPCPFCLNPR